MPGRDWNIMLIWQTIDDDLPAVEPLLFTELFCCDHKSSRLRSTIAQLTTQMLETLPAFELHRRALADTAKTDSVEVTLKPPTRQPAWVEPVTLRFDVVRWRQGKDAIIARVPALSIEVIASQVSELPKLLTEQITAALRRSGSAESLFELALKQRITSLELIPHTVPVHLKTARQRARADEAAASSSKLMIQQVGHVMGTKPTAAAFEVETAVESLAGLLTGRVPRSVLLIGPSGSGKSTIVEELVRRKKSLQLGDVPFWSTSGSRLIAGMSGFGMWQQRCQQLCKEATRDKAILHLGSLVELMQVGRIGGSGGIAGFLRPFINRGDILVIAECTTEQLATIERLDAHLLELFHQQRVEEPDAAAGRRILAAVADHTGRKTTAQSAWLSTLDRLHRRYATYSAYPGRPVRFLLNLLKDLPTETTPTSADVIDAFARESGLPRFMLDPDSPLELPAARQWFASRLIGQDRAVDLVVDLLATVKAALSRPRRPIASLLFVGPTGVGKTELAKALAEYFFADRARLTRFDMSEFASPLAVQRLIGGIFGAEGLLTAKVREQPFSVLLFDEFEKAHPSFFDLLLQVLGEGRLTDAAGRLGDFSNTIVVMTSNLGAESFGRGSFGLSRGSGDGFADPQQHFTDELRDFLRPELFNRIDRIVPFMPLNQQNITQIARRELSLLLQRDGLKLRGVDLQLSDAAVNHLVRKGYDIRYGARPLKRAIERELLSPLADAIFGYDHQSQLRADADARDGTLMIDVKAIPHADARHSSREFHNAVLQATSQRRSVQRCQGSTVMLGLVNQLYRLQREQERFEARQKTKEKPAFHAIRAARIKELRETVDELEEIAMGVTDLEDKLQTRFYTGGDNADLTASSTLRERFDALKLKLLVMQSPRPHFAVLGVLGNLDFVRQLALAYIEVADAFSYNRHACWYSVHGRDTYKRSPIQSLQKFLDNPDPATAGIGLVFTGNCAGLRFAPEKGIHLFENARETLTCIVEAPEGSLANYAPTPRKDWPRDAALRNFRRLYQLDKERVLDSLTDEAFNISHRLWRPLVAQSIDLQLRMAAEAVVES